MTRRNDIIKKLICLNNLIGIALIIVFLIPVIIKFPDVAGTAKVFTLLLIQLFFIPVDVFIAFSTIAFWKEKRWALMAQKTLYGLQIVEVEFGNLAFDFDAGIQLSVTFGPEGSQIGINALALVIFILLIRLTKDYLKMVPSGK